MFDPLEATLRQLAAVGGHELVLGLLAFAMPNGPTVRGVYESLRDELLDGLRSAMPVDAVVLPLHGAMIAEGYPDCEGDVIERVRRIVGPDIPIGIELDLHCHFTEKMRTQANVIVAYKEYPHTDLTDRLEEVWNLTIATAEKKIHPMTAVFDCRMTDLWHTTHEPMQSFVRRMQALEGRDGILSVSFGHGFPWGDVSEAGAKIWVVTDGDQVAAKRTAEMLGREIFEMRDKTRVQQTSLGVALDRLDSDQRAGLWVLADIADNAGGGASSDSTFILRELIERKMTNVALGGFWDLGAVQICREGGVGAKIALRVGGKCGPPSGTPVDLVVTVRAIDEAHYQTGLGGSRLPCGASTWVSTEDGIDIVLISLRGQVIGTDFFTRLGIDLTNKRAVVVKSSQHFREAFGPISKEVVYVDTPGLLRNDFENVPFAHRDANYWPRVADPWAVQV